MIVLHDFAGHPFQVQLSRSLAARGTQVLHLYSTAAVTGRGQLDRVSGDSDSLVIEGVSTPARFERYSPIARIRYERAYARSLVERLDAVRPALFITCNTPLFVLPALMKYLKRTRLPWILWHQDLVSLAVSHEAHRKLPRVVALGVAKLAAAIEKTSVMSASYVVPIGDLFLTQYAAWGVNRSEIETIPNWAPLDEIYPTNKSNCWTRCVGLRASGTRLVYSGTLGRKHNAGLLVQLLDQVKAFGIDAELLVVSEGDGADDLRRATYDRSDVVVHGYVPMRQLREVLGAGDILVALLEPDAAGFSIPSKVLSYLASGRPTMLLAPLDNPAVRTVRLAGGYAAAPDASGVRGGARWTATIARNVALRDSLGRRARRYAEDNFAISNVTDRFEAICSTVVGTTMPDLDDARAQSTSRASAGDAT